MRVFYDHQVTSLQNAGGVSRYYFELVQALLQLSPGQVRPELMLGLQRSVLPFGSLRPGARVSSVEGTMRPGYLRYALNEVWTGMSIPWRGRFDVYHATYQRILPSVRKRAVVVTHHDSTPDRYPELFSGAASIHRRLRSVYARADRIICISAASRDDLLRYYEVAPEKTTVIHHGFAPLPAVPGDEPPAVSGRAFLLYVGARAAYKNFPMLLEAFSRQPEKELQLVAVGGGQFSDAESILIERLGLTGRVHSRSRVNDAQLADLYRQAKLFVYPSLYEGFGFPPLEAMSVGCPALVSRTSALPEICGEAAFYFDPGSVEDLTGCIAELLNHPEFCLSRQQAGFKQVKRYTWQQAAQETFAVYQQALAEAGKWRREP